MIPLIKNINEPVEAFKTRRPRKGVNPIDYDKFKILMTHALYIPNYKQAAIILDASERDAAHGKHKAMDHFYANNRYINQFIYPPIFIQSGHISEIDGSKLKRKNNNDKLNQVFESYLSRSYGENNFSFYKKKQAYKPDSV